MTENGVFQFFAGSLTFAAAVLDFVEGGFIAGSIAMVAGGWMWMLAGWQFARRWGR